jgi:hypothetical protein
MQKKDWNKPELTVHGSVAEITADKTWGFADTFIIIKNVPGNGGGTGS